MNSQKVPIVILSLSKGGSSWFDEITMTAYIKFDFLRVRHFSFP